MEIIDFDAVVGVYGGPGWWWWDCPGGVLLGQVCVGIYMIRVVKVGEVAPVGSVCAFCASSVMGR